MDESKQLNELEREIKDRQKALLYPNGLAKQLFPRSKPITTARVLKILKG